MKFRKRIVSLLTVMVMAVCMVGIKASAYGLVYYSASASSGNDMVYYYSGVSGTSGATSNDRFYVATGGTHTVYFSTSSSCSRTIKLNCSNSSYTVIISVAKGGAGIPSQLSSNVTLRTGYYYTPQVIPPSGMTISGNFTIGNAYLKTD